MDPAFGRVPELTLNASSGQTGLVQFAESLQVPIQWNNLTNLALNGPSAVWRDTTIASSGKRFYRVIFQSRPGNTNPPAATPRNMVWLPPGTFQMGSPEEDPDHITLELPASRVTLTRGFWISKYEVTQEEFQSVMGYNPSFFQAGPNLPVDSVSWNEAVHYCALLTEKEKAALPAGYQYRLPTEAEWEYAARSGSTNRFSFGDDPDYSLLPQYAWTDENSFSSTHPVGQKRANPWGLFDIYGNVFEWCLDRSGAYSSEDKIDPQGPAAGTDRIYRGGSWANVAWESRAAMRGGLDPAIRLNCFGFRVVLAPLTL